MELVWLKVLAACMVFVLILIPAILPLKVADWFMSRGERGQWYMSIIGCFGGGVFMGAYLIHLMPEVDHLIRVYLMEPRGIDFPIANTLCGAGFFMLLFIENLMHRLKEVADKREIKQMEKKFKKQEKSSISPNESSDDVIDCERNTPKINFGMESDDDFTNNKNITPVETVRNGGLTIQSRAFDTQASTDTVLSTSASEANLVEPCDQSMGPMKAIVMFVALSADALFAGLSCGLQKTDAGVWNMVIAIVAHELVISFMLGLELVKNYKPKTAFWLDFAYAAGNPLGILLGLAIYEGMGDDPFFESLSGILQALCGGVFIYVTFMEILPHEYIGTNCPYRALAILCGFGFMALMKLIPHAGEHHAEHADMTTISNVVTTSSFVTQGFT